MPKIIFELCADTLAACAAARHGGAHRIELCSALSEEGLTPSHALIREAVQRSGLPVHVMLRPRGGNFVYARDELALIREDLLHAKELGASGVVLGLLTPDHRVEIEGTRALVELAAPLPVTFHRAFDSTLDLAQALEDVIAAGCARVLTSGGQATATQGAQALAALVRQAAGRIDVAIGGGVRSENAAWLARSTKATHFHASLLPGSSSQQASEQVAVTHDRSSGVSSAAVRRILKALRSV